MEFPFKIKKNREFDIVGFGTNAVDYLITVPEFPVFNSKIELRDYSRLAGGEIATTMTGLQRLGLKTAYAGRFGDDEAGDFGLQSLVNEGVGTRYAEQVPGAKTQIAFILIDERSGERTIIWKRDAGLSYSENEVSEGLATSGTILHVTPHDAAACIRLARTAREAGTVVSIDLDRILERIEELMPLVDVLICSADFAKKFTGLDDPRSAILKLHERFGPAVTGTTLGDKGSLVYCSSGFIESPGFEVPGGCKDTTGAGDSFRAGLLYGLYSGWTVEESCRAANAVAALKCREVGARTALPTEAELKRFLDDTS